MRAQNATGDEAETKVMYELMRIVKTQEGREEFVYKLDPERLPATAAKLVYGSCVAIQSKRTFEFLSVLVKAALREGVYTRDFQLNKVGCDESNRNINQSQRSHHQRFSWISPTFTTSSIRRKRPTCSCI